MGWAACLGERACFNSPETGGGSSPVKTGASPDCTFVVVVVVVVSLLCRCCYLCCCVDVVVVSDAC